MAISEKIDERIEELKKMFGMSSSPKSEEIDEKKEFKRITSQDIAKVKYALSGDHKAFQKRMFDEFVHRKIIPGISSGLPPASVFDGSGEFAPLPTFFKSQSLMNDLCVHLTHKIQSEGIEGTIQLAVNHKGRFGSFIGSSVSSTSPYKVEIGLYFVDHSVQSSKTLMSTEISHPGEEQIDGVITMMMVEMCSEVFIGFWKRQGLN